jgi:5-methyltetrahydrofolate--homocysteine methyltransferase
VRAIHRSYVLAGAQCLVTNTFQSNPAALAKHGLEDRLEEINQAAIAIARSVCAVGHFVLASVGPMKVDWDAFDRVVASLSLADGILLETWSQTFGPLAVERARRASVIAENMPVMVSFAYKPGPIPGMFHITGGLGPMKVAGRLEASGIRGVGVNCGRDIGMDDVIDILRAYRKVTDLPILARPNAGTPQRVGDRWVYPHTPERMAARLPELIDAGATLIGGCCGTTPDHIAAFRQVIDRLGVGWKP